VWSLDFLIGTVTTTGDFKVGGEAAAYSTLIEHKLENVPAEDQCVVRRDMAVKSLGARVLEIMEAYGLAVDQIVKTEPGLASHVAAVARVEPSLVASAKLFWAWGRLASYHLHLIKSHLTSVANQLPAGVRLAVNPREGSGGLAMEEVKAITLMRIRHPQLRPVVDIIRPNAVASAA
jgi:hypothetical protein